MRRLGRYEILDELGRGGMGIVYRGEDTALGRTVAIKTVRLGEYATPLEARTLRERLLREARAAAALAHPNIVAVHDVGEEDGTTYIVMELIQGRTLEDAAADHPPPPPEWFLKVLEDAARALDYAHSQGVCHRDVKPANIMVQENGAVKIADFGVAKLSFQKTITESGMVVGSPHYMAPEQLRGEAITGRTDQFALAGTAYTVLTGHRPFDADTLASLVSKILHDDPPPDPSLHPEVERVLRKAMSKDPAKRYATCAEFIEALKAACKPVAKPSAPPTRPAAGARKTRPRWLSLAGVAALLALAAFLLIERYQASQAEIAYWDSIKGRREAALFEAYLKEYPNGRFAELARAEIDALRTSPPAPGPPAIAEFVAEPGTIQRGQPATLRWRVSEASEVSIDPGVGAVLAAGRRPVSPTDTITYTLSARSAGGSISQRTTVTVALAPPKPPAIAEFVAEPGTIQRGQPVTLRWRVSEASTVSIDPGVGAIPAAGSRRVFPADTTTYTLSGKGPGGSVSERAIVAVAAPPKTPAIAEFVAEPGTIQRGQPATLRWRVSEASEVSIDPGIGGVLPAGSREVSPSETTTYTLSASGPGGSIADRTTVTVAVPPKPPAISEFVADPGTIQRGQPATLRWRVSEAREVSIEPGIGAVPAAGSRRVSPTETTSYTLTARGPGGSVSERANLAVTLPAEGVQTAAARTTVPATEPPPPSVRKETGSDARAAEGLLRVRVLHFHGMVDQYNNYCKGWLIVQREAITFRGDVHSFQAGFRDVEEIGANFSGLGRTKKWFNIRVYGTGNFNFRVIDEKTDAHDNTTASRAGEVVRRMKVVMGRR